MLVYDGRQFVVSGDGLNRFSLVLEGWKLDKDSGSLYTDDATLAEKLKSHISDSVTQSALDVKLSERDIKLRLSSCAELPVTAAIDLKAPKGLEYLGYQRAGILYALGNEHTLIADEMGLGKTIQGIGVINNTPNVNNVLILCPASLKLNWRRELEKWLIRWYDIFVVQPNTRRIPEYAEIIIINYDLLNKHAGALKSREYDILILDESHYVKNYSAKRTQIVIGTSKIPPQPGIRAKKKIALSGTPVLNKPEEIWPLWYYFYPDTAPSKARFDDRYCGVKLGRYKTIPKNLEELQHKLRSRFMVRRLKKDVLKQLPSKVRQIIDVEDSGAKSAEAAALKQVRDNFEERAKSMQSSAKLLVFAELAEIRHATALRKVPAAVQHVADIVEAGNKIVVFGYHRDVIEGVVEGLKKRKIRSVTLTGSTKQADRQKAVDDFQNDPKCMVFVGNIKAAGVGLTLTSASNVLFVELDWVPGNLNQAEDRCHRLGQTDTVLAQYLVIDGTIDARMAEAIIQKQKIVEKTIDSLANQGHNSLIDDTIDPLTLF